MRREEEGECFRHFNENIVAKSPSIFFRKLSISEFRRGRKREESDWIVDSLSLSLANIVDRLLRRLFFPVRRGF